MFLDDDTEKVFDEFSKRNWRKKVLSTLKLLFVLGSYAFVFVSLSQVLYWLMRIPEFPKLIIPTFAHTWIIEKYNHRVWWDVDTKFLGQNILLCLAFVVQHTLMSTRVLSGTLYWRWAHQKLQIHRSLYLIGSGFALQAVVRYWQPVPVILWRISFLEGYHVYIHYFAWLVLYLTNLMLDLPDMIGLTEVSITSPTYIPKSPDLQLLYRNQRHMGMFPLMTILLVHPLMTLDRFMLILSLYAYMCNRWSSYEDFQYVTRMQNQRVISSVGFSRN